MSYQKYSNGEDGDVKIDIDDEQVDKSLYQQKPTGSANLFEQPQEDEKDGEGNGESVGTTNIIAEVKEEETNNGAKYGFKVDPDQLSQLSAELVDEGKTFFKAIAKYKRAFFSELDNEVSENSTYH